MKKVLMSIFAVAAMASCKKEVIKTTTSNGSTSDLTETSFITKTTAMRVFNGVSCSGSGGTCLDEVIVWGEKAIFYDNLFLEITDLENKEDIKLIVGHHYGVLTKDIDSKLLDAVIEGELLLEAKENIDIQTKFFIFANEEGKNVAVYPFEKK